MPDIQLLYQQYQKAKSRRDLWENVWKECYEYALPQRESVFSENGRRSL